MKLIGLTSSFPIGRDEMALMLFNSDGFERAVLTDENRFLHTVFTYAMLGERKFCRLRSSACVTMSAASRRLGAKCAYR